MNHKAFDINRFAKRICHDERTLEMFRYLVNNSYLRVVRFYGTPAVNRGRFDSALRNYRRHFDPVAPADVATFFSTRKWPKEKPGLLLCMLGGYRDQYDIMAPLLDKYGFHGWFFVTPGFTNTPPERQAAYALRHNLAPPGLGAGTGSRIAMDWREVQALSRRHTIGSNSFGNVMIGNDMPRERLYEEIVGSKKAIEAHTGQAVKVFHWMPAEEYNYNVDAHHMLEKAGYQYVLSNLKLERISAP